MYSLSQREEINHGLSRLAVLPQKVGSQAGQSHDARQAATVQFEPLLG